MISVTATDGDSMDTLVYDITDGRSYYTLHVISHNSLPHRVGDEDKFQIDSSSGLISTGAVSLDREEQAEYTLTVTVSDSSLRTVISTISRHDGRCNMLSLFPHRMRLRW